MGQAADALDLIDRLAAAVDGPYAAAVAAHVHALASGDADDLAAAAREFEVIGAELVAAEAHRSAANAYRRAGRGASAAVADRRVEALLEWCGHPRSPGLEPVGVMGEELTDREREVAVLAARGRTSPEIAATLFVSVRTVDTHLHRVYRKLMIEGRHQLAAALGLEGGGSPPGLAT
jgi:DNA-binding NarL/FixJ family response regulator